MSKWQPIETAPIDVEFLAYDSRTGKMDVCHNLAGTPDNEPYIVAVQRSWDGPDLNEFGWDMDAISHWMPLPEPPTGEE